MLLSFTAAYVRWFQHEIVLLCFFALQFSRPIPHIFFFTEYQGHKADLRLQLCKIHRPHLQGSIYNICYTCFIIYETYLQLLSSPFHHSHFNNWIRSQQHVHSLIYFNVYKIYRILLTPMTLAVFGTIALLHRSKKCVLSTNSPRPIKNIPS